jgi:hypothetical protein
MGGGAFENTQRLDVAAQARIEALVLETLKSHGLTAMSPLELADKSSFGDVDICVLMPNEYALVGSAALAGIKAALGVTEPFVQSGHVLSLLSAERYQVDLLVCHDRIEYPVMCQYLSHGDLSNILGLALTNWHLKLGLEGLFLKVRAVDVQRYCTVGVLHKEECIPTRKLESVRLSQDVQVMNAFLGLPPALGDTKTRFTMAQLFGAITATPFVSAADFPLSGHKFKHRKGRPMFTAFAEYATSHPHFDYHTGLREQFEADPFAWKMAVARQFGCEAAMVARLELLVRVAQRKALTRVAKAKFSAKTLMLWYPGLQHRASRESTAKKGKGRTIGRLIQKLKFQVAEGSDAGCV